MTQEDRTLLHIDLSARSPYDTVLRVKGLVTSNEEFGDAYLDTVSWYEEVSVRDGSRVSYDIADVRPYLRPMSSMTEEEFTKLKEYSGLVYDQLDLTSFQNGAYKCLDFYLSEVPSGAVIRVFDWLNKYHFDYRDLIQMGLALEAPEGMYNS